jgi:hypothetical protein
MCGDEREKGNVGQIMQRGREGGGERKAEREVNIKMREPKVPR